jgi:hypothetical protein
MPSFIPATGRTLNVVGVWVNRTGEESSKAEDWDRVRELQTGIDDAQGQLEIIRQLDDAVPG